MYSYNSIHKVFVVIIIVAWAVFHFQSRNEENLKYEDGDPIRTGGTENNLNHGQWTWYHQNGKVQISGRYNQGKREGVWKIYDSTGLLILESTYAENKLNGILKQYNAKGEVIREESYRNDTLIKQDLISD